MTFVVVRGDRAEVRESHVGPDGPRSRTLLTFATLTDDLAQRAAGRATRPTTPAQVVRAARAAGAPVAGSRADAAAADLLRLLDERSPLSERLRRLLADRLGPPPEDLPDQARQAAPWSGRPPAYRGEVLRDLLGLGDAMPFRERENRPRFPRLRSS
jgi:hypothetical protein